MKGREREAGEEKEGVIGSFRVSLILGSGCRFRFCMISCLCHYG